MHLQPWPSSRGSQSRRGTTGDRTDDPWESRGMSGWNYDRLSSQAGEHCFRHHNFIISHFLSVVTTRTLVSRQSSWKSWQFRCRPCPTFRPLSRSSPRQPIKGAMHSVALWIAKNSFVSRFFTLQNWTLLDQRENTATSRSSSSVTQFNGLK